jgi:CheY-like chemotaxis protein
MKKDEILITQIILDNGIQDNSGRVASEEKKETNFKNMNKEVVILIAEDDEGHAGLIRKNLTRSGIANEIIHFKDGQEVVNFLFCKGDGLHRQSGVAYVLLLDIRMPKLDGVEVLKLVKADPDLRMIPTIMITTTDDPQEVENCHKMGCSNYITKPVEYDAFVNSIRQLGLFLTVVQVPKVNTKE